MSFFVKVTSKEKKCPVLINMEHVIEIAPHEGGTMLFFVNPEAKPYAVGNLGDVSYGRTGLPVTEPFSMFEQFTVTTVSANDIAVKVAALKPKADVKV